MKAIKKVILVDYQKMEMRKIRHIIKDMKLDIMMLQKIAKLAFTVKSDPTFTTEKNDRLFSQPIKSCAPRQCLKLMTLLNLGLFL